MTSQAAATGKRPSVGLFVTCLVDLFRPSIGFAAIKLLQDAGAAVEVPESQTCCGQPAYNSGDREDAKAIAKAVIESFERFDYVVAPSGSCAGMLKLHYPTPLGRRSGVCRKSACAWREELRAHELPGRGARRRQRDGEVRRQRHLSRFLLVLARAESA